MSYLDNAATTQVYCPSTKPASIEFDAFSETPAQTLRANPKRGVYQASELATQALIQARQRIAQCIGAKPHQCLFVPSTSYALNLLALSASQQLQQAFTTVVEHHSNYLPWRQFFQHHEIIDATHQGEIKLQSIARSRYHRPRTIAFSLGSNVTGNIIHSEQLQHLNPSVDLIVADATQYLAHQNMDVTQSNISAMAFSAHKLFALGGVGVLWINDYWLDRLIPPFWGGGMVDQAIKPPFTSLDPPDSWELGSLPTESIQSLANSFEWLTHIHQLKLNEITESLLDQLQALDYVTLYGNVSAQDRLPIMSFNIDRIHPHDIAQWLAQDNVCVRAGHHCASPLMHHLGIDACVRVSLAPYNNFSDIQQFIEAVKSAKANLG